MLRGLFILSKDMDIEVAKYINLHVGNKMKIDIVTWRHKDYLAIKYSFPEIENVYSLAEYRKTTPLHKSKVLDEYVGFEGEYSLRCSSRYTAYDYFRAVRQGEDYLSAIERNLHFVKFFLQLELSRYDFVMGELSRSYGLICYDLCKHYSVKYLHPVNLGIISGIMFSDDSFQPLEGGSRSDLGLCRKRAKEVVFSIREKGEYKNSFLNKTVKDRLKSLFMAVFKFQSMYFEVMSYSIDVKYNSGYLYYSPFSRLVTRLVRPEIKKRMQRRFFVDKVSHKYYYYPLHVLPETTTSLFSEMEIDFSSEQGYFIEFLSKVVPSDHKLVVKEHPAMFGNRRSLIYKNILSFCNVELLSPLASGYEIIKNCSCVITHCGTVGVEALVLGKPVVVVGNPYYKDFPGILSVPNIKDLSLIQSFVENWTRPSDEEILAKLEELLSNVYFGVKNFNSEENSFGYNEANYELFYKAIQDIVKE